LKRKSKSFEIWTARSAHRWPGFFLLKHRETNCLAADVRSGRPVLGNRAVQMSKKPPYKSLAANWGNGEVIVELSLDKDQWDRIVRGDRFKIKGRGYWYDGEWFQDIWDFNSGLHDAELIVWYGQPSISDFSGQGYVGPINDVLISGGK
jgi:hypothetical protein